MIHNDDVMSYKEIIQLSIIFEVIGWAILVGAFYFHYIPSVVVELVLWLKGQGGIFQRR